jgi:hypothetical protein
MKRRIPENHDEKAPNSVKIIVRNGYTQQIFFMSSGKTVRDLKFFMRRPNVYVYDIANDEYLDDEYVITKDLHVNVAERTDVVIPTVIIPGAFERCSVCGQSLDEDSSLFCKQTAEASHIENFEKIYDLEKHIELSKAFLCIECMKHMIYVYRNGQIAFKFVSKKDNSETVRDLKILLASLGLNCSRLVDANNKEVDDTTKLDQILVLSCE